jgi:hypothetical protein
MTRKPFDEELDKACDPETREAVKLWVRRNWQLFAEDGEKYKADLLLKREGQPVAYAEVEMRSWGGKRCPHKTIHIAERKEKLLKNNLPTLMFALNDDLRYGYMCIAERILNCNKIEVKNKYVAENEYFYDVPIDYFRYIQLR